jgi:DHA2 family multidrug resistance protein
MPRSIVMLITIPIVGAIYNKTSPKLVIIVGLFLGGVTCWMMSKFTLTTPYSQIIIPQMIQGLALACIFIPLSTVSLATIERVRMSDATGLNNLIRQLGGSFGVAIFASLLGRFANQSRTLLVAHVASNDPSIYARRQAMVQAFMARGSDLNTAGLQAVRALDLQVAAQAGILAFERDFRIGGILFFLMIPLVFLLETPHHEAADAKEHAHPVEI